MSQKSPILTPESLLEEFKKTNTPFGWTLGYKAIDQLDKVENKTAYYQPTVEFLNTERIDNVRAWGTTVLERMTGKEAQQAFDVLAKLIDEQGDYPYTKFFALRALSKIPKTSEQKTLLQQLLLKLQAGKQAKSLFYAGAVALVASDKNYDDDIRNKAIQTASLMLKAEDWAENFWILRSLREFPSNDLIDELILARQNRDYSEDNKRSAILALGGLNEPDCVLRATREVGIILRTDPNSYLRLAAVQSLRRLSYSETQEDLVIGLNDENAEVRVQAADALSVLLKSGAARVIVQHMLKEEMPPGKLTHLIEALRRIDPSRAKSTEALSKELDSEDKERAQRADDILVELGGWEAVQRVNQRRKTLEALRGSLEKSEAAVTDAFKSTMLQANRNFYFAMSVNIIIVMVGISLVVLALIHLVQNPDQLESWVLAGGSGVFGVIVGFYFNNSRKNGRDDLATLVNITVIFQGFLRRLKQIDAAFEKSYMESQFKMEDMKTTVEQIDSSVARTLDQITSKFNPSAQQESQEQTKNGEKTPTQPTKDSSK